MIRACKLKKHIPGRALAFLAAVLLIWCSILPAFGADTEPPETTALQTAAEETQTASEPAEMETEAVRAAEAPAEKATETATAAEEPANKETEAATAAEAPTEKETAPTAAAAEPDTTSVRTLKDAASGVAVTGAFAEGVTLKVTITDGESTTDTESGTVTRITLYTIVLSDGSQPTVRVTLPVTEATVEEPALYTVTENGEPDKAVTAEKDGSNLVFTPDKLGTFALRTVSAAAPAAMLTAAPAAEETTIPAGEKAAEETTEPTEESAAEETSTVIEETTVEETTAEEPAELFEELPVLSIASAPMLAAANGTDTYVGYGVRNPYVYSIQGVNDYNFYIDYEDADGNKETYLAYCYNKDKAGPETGKEYSLTYPNATNYQFYQSSSVTRVSYYYFQAVASRIIYYGYPYNQSGHDYFTEVIKTYGIEEPLARDAFRWATQNALWYWTTGEPDLSAYQGVTSGPNAMLGLAYAIYKQAYDEGYTVPDGLSMDIYTPTSGNVQNMLVLHRFTEPVVPSVEKTEASGTKTWADQGNTKNRPESVTIHLYGLYWQEDTPVTFDTGQTQSVAGSADTNTWDYTFTNLNKYYNGNLITYFVAEDNVPTGYIATVDGMNVTNSSTPDDEQPQTQPGSVTLMAKKLVDGEAPGNRSFRFVLFSDGNPVQETENDAEGNIRFPLTFTAPGVYTYVIKEVDDGQTGIAYDTSDITATVTVRERDLYEFTADVYYSVEGSSRGYFISDTPNGTDFPVYCIDTESISPGTQSLISQPYLRISNPDTATLSQYVTENRYGDALAENLRRLCWYLDANPDGLSEQYKKSYMWGAVNSEWASGALDEKLNEVFAMDVPDSYQLVLFVPQKYVRGDSTSFQPLLGGIGVTAGYGQEPVFHNTTLAPTGARMPDTGGSGTAEIRYAGGIFFLAAAFMQYHFIKKKERN